MSHTLQFVKARASHVRIIAGKCEKSTRGRLSSGDSSPLAAMSQPSEPRLCRYRLLDGVPVMMFGVSDLNVLAGIGSPWLVPCTDSDQCMASFVRYSSLGSTAFLATAGIQSFAASLMSRTGRRSAGLKWLGVKFNFAV